MIIRRQGDGLDSKLRSAALTARLARTAELFAAGRARRGAGFAEEVHTVVAEEERVGRSGTTLAPGRFEGAEFRVPVEFGDAFGFLADEPRGDFTHRKRYGQDVAGLDADFQGVLADQVIQFGGAVQFGGGHAATLPHDGIRFGGAARDALSDLAQQVLIVGVDALGVARQAAGGVLFDGGGETPDFGLHGAQRDRKKLRQFVVGNRRLRVFLQIVLHRLRQEFRLRYQGAGRRVEADGDDTEAGFVALDGVVKAEEVVARALLVVFDHTIDAVLQRQSAVQRAVRSHRRHLGGPAKARAHHAGIRWQQAAGAVEPFDFVVRSRVGAEAQREPFARLQSLGELRRKQGAQGTGVFGLDQGSAADEQVPGPIDDAYHLHLGIYTSKSWAKRASSSS